MAANTFTHATSAPSIEIPGSWESLLKGENKQRFESLLPNLLKERRWFGGKGRVVKSLEVREAVPFTHDGCTSFLCLIHVEYVDGNPETYLLPLSYAEGRLAARLLEEEKSPAFLRVHSSQGDGVIYDAVRDRGFVAGLLHMLDTHGENAGGESQIEARPTGKYSEIRRGATSESRVMGAEQSNTSIVFGEQLILKLFRRVEEGINPDFEIGQFLTEHGYFHSPPVAGALELHPGKDEPSTIAILQGFVPNQGDAWKYTLQVFGETLTRVMQSGNKFDSLPRPPAVAYTGVPEPPSHLLQVAGGYFELVRLLAQRTAELHLTLDSDQEDPNFAPEPLDAGYRRTTYRGMRALASTVISLLRVHMDKLGPAERKLAGSILAEQGHLLELFSPVLDEDLHADRIRIHGDYHLGQVLFTGDDFVIIDFEGEPLRSLKERRVKRSPLQDIAGMVRSFDYAGYAGLLELRNPPDAEEDQSLYSFVAAWTAWVSAVFISRYLEIVADAPFLPSSPAKTSALLDCFCLDKAVYELGYEINNRPTWVRIPLNGIARMLEHRAAIPQRKVA